MDFTLPPERLGKRRQLFETLNRVQDGLAELKELTANRAKREAAANLQAKGSKETQEKGVQTSFSVWLSEEREEAATMHEADDDDNDVNAIADRTHADVGMAPKREWGWQTAGWRLSAALLMGAGLAMGVLIRQYWIKTAGDNGGYLVAEATGVSAWARYSGDIAQ